MAIHVAAAAILDDQGRVLVRRRADHMHQGGLWEFPGGKVEAGESTLDALIRELKEELNIQPQSIEPLIRIHHQYDDRRLVLDFFRVTRIQGEVEAMEGQPLRWLTPDQMLPEQFPAADRPVINALKLPDRYLITGSDPRDPPGFLQRLERSLQAGISMVQLRAHQLDDNGYRHLFDAAQPLCQRYGASLLLNRAAGCREWMDEADGIHLPARQLMSLHQRPQEGGLVGASCHNRLQLERASKLELDYALLSPVLTTASHPQAATLGWETFADWVETASLPVYALGGMQSNHLQQAKQAGAQGIAGISGLWLLD